jgi:MFS-type transporter involved in bile tolerance (Atg22 family)
LIAYLSILVQPHSLSGLYLVAALTGLVIGNTQSYIRALYALSTEKMHAGRQFGIYSIITQAAALVGTWVYGIASDFMHSQRTPMLFVALTMVIGFLLIRSSIGSTSGVSD